MGCGDEKLSKSLTQTFTAHCNALICQQVTLSGDAEWPKVADAVIEARRPIVHNIIAPALIMASATPFCFYKAQKHLKVKIANISMAYDMTTPIFL